MEKKLLEIIERDQKILKEYESVVKKYQDDREESRYEDFMAGARDMQRHAQPSEETLKMFAEMSRVTAGMNSIINKYTSSDISMVKISMEKRSEDKKHQKEKIKELKKQTNTLYFLAFLLFWILVKV